MVISCLYIKIYRIIVVYRRSGDDQVRRNRSRNAEHSYKAFLTTLLLIGALAALWMPLLVFTFVSSFTEIDNYPSIVIDIKFYIIDFLPMLIFITDPLIYGLRVVEIRKGYRRLFHQIFPCCVEDVRQNSPTCMSSAMRSTTSFRNNYSRVNLL